LCLVVHLITVQRHGAAGMPIRAKAFSVVEKAAPSGAQTGVERTLEERTVINGSVLVIDDEEMVRDVVAAILESEEIKVLVASDGLSGIEIYRSHVNEIAVVLLDLSMPGIKGEETFRRLKEINPDVRVVLSSGYSEATSVAHFGQGGAAGFIKKPYKGEALLAILRKAAAGQETDL